MLFHTPEFLFLFLPITLFAYFLIGRFSKFAALIERHWEGIAAYCTPRNKVKLGFVEGLSNKIRNKGFSQASGGGIWVAAGGFGAISVS
jgi:hypothetical protein